MQHTPSTPNRRSQAAQSAVDRYALDRAAKNERSLELASAHGLTHAAQAVVIERDAAGFCHQVACLVASGSDPRHPHLVVYDADDDSADCDCLAGQNGLPCGHAGATLVAGRAAAAYLLLALDAHNATLMRSPSGPARRTRIVTL